MIRAIYRNQYYNDNTSNICNDIANNMKTYTYSGYTEDIQETDRRQTGDIQTTARTQTGDQATDRRHTGGRMKTDRRQTGDRQKIIIRISNYIGIRLFILLAISL